MSFVSTQLHVVVQPTTLSIAGICARNQVFFGGPSIFLGQDFAKKEGPKRLVYVQKTPLSNSGNKIWSEQLKMLRDGDAVPSAHSVVLAILKDQAFADPKAHRMIFTEAWVRTSDTLLNGDRILVLNSSKGIVFTSVPDEEANPSFMLAVSREV